MPTTSRILKGSPTPSFHFTSMVEVGFVPVSTMLKKKFCGWSTTPAEMSIFSCRATSAAAGSSERTRSDFVIGPTNRYVSKTTVSVAVSPGGTSLRDSFACTQLHSPRAMGWSGASPAFVIVNVVSCFSVWRTTP